MSRLKKNLIISLSLIAILLIGSIGFVYYKSVNKQIAIILPLNNACFPADFVCPTIYWNDTKEAKPYKLSIHLKDKKNFYTEIVDSTIWKPRLDVWKKIQANSQHSNIEIAIERVNDKYLLFKNKAKITINISADSVNASILYRQLPLPFSFAEQNIWMTSYSLKNVANEGSFHNVLGSFEACGNCHSLSQDGKNLALDFDAVSRDKGGYFIAKMDSVVRFDTSNYVSWSKLTGRNTFGLLSKMSPDGRYIVTTVKDRVISEKLDYNAEKEYSQLFFPINGVLAIYDTKTKKLVELSGANDPKYVQSNATWTPDNKYIIFARAKAVPFPYNDSVFDCFLRDRVVISEYVERKRTLKYDLYKVPFNNGKGGIAEPIEGASNNEKSNYFPTVSPNGKWIAFCQAENFMMLQKDSRIYILPVEGGKAKLLKSNFNSMNSWHAWSPNSKWLLFTTKPINEYTDMFLTHIDDNGNASIPVMVENAKRLHCAVNYPEFVNCSPDFKFRMDYEYINFFNIDKLLDKKKFPEAKALLNKYLAQIKTATPIEYVEIARICTRLGDEKGYEKYSTLARQTDRVFSRAK